MRVCRIVATIPATGPLAPGQFYRDVFGPGLPHEMGWIAFLAGDGAQAIEIHAASQGGSGTGLPMISIEADDLAAAATAIRDAGASVDYGPVTEDRGPRRFQQRDPAGSLVNIVSSV